VQNLSACVTPRAAEPLRMRRRAVAPQPETADSQTRGASLSAIFSADFDILIETIPKTIAATNDAIATTAVLFPEFILLPNSAFRISNSAARAILEREEPMSI